MEWKLIDLSYHNNNIDFTKVKTQIHGILLRCGYGSNQINQDDKKFTEYAQACILQQIPFGVYLYSYAKTAQEAVSEAEHCLRLLNPYKGRLSYPVYLDLEEPGTESKVVERVLIFAEIIEKNSFQCGIYSNESWWNTYLTDSRLDKFTKWVAKYGKNDGMPHDKPNISSAYDIWQYTSAGKIDGINGNVDMNICYRDFPSELSDKIKPNISQPPQKTYMHTVGEHIIFSTCYAASTDPQSKAIPAARMSKNHGIITKIVNAPNPYLLDNGMCWVNDGDIRGQYTGSALTSDSQINYYPQYTGSSVSIAEALQAVKADSSFANRQKIAKKNGITDYTGSSEQNGRLLSLLKNGKLIK